MSIKDTRKEKDKFYIGDDGKKHYILSEYEETLDDLGQWKRDYEGNKKKK